jgi:hypothetical protein
MIALMRNRLARAIGSLDQNDCPGFNRQYHVKVDLYFDGAYQPQFNSIIKDFRNRGIVKEQNGELHTTAKP